MEDIKFDCSHVTLCNNTKTTAECIDEIERRIDILDYKINDLYEQDQFLHGVNTDLQHQIDDIVSNQKLAEQAKRLSDMFTNEIAESKSTIKQTADGITLTVDMGERLCGKEILAKINELDCSFDYYNGCLKTNITVDKADAIIERVEDIMKEGNKMELLEIYERKALDAIARAHCDEMDNIINENNIVKKYRELTKNFEDTLESLYNSEENKEESVLYETLFDNTYKYRISCNYTDKISESIEKKYDVLKVNLKNKLEEVEAQIELIKNTSNDYNEIMGILRSYNIVDINYKLKEYEIPTNGLETCEGCRCDKTSKKRGIKPKVKVNENSNN